MRIFLTRHGETLENKAGIVQGHDQGTLSPLGKEQAMLLALRFIKEKFDEIYTSNLARAHYTAKAIWAYQRTPPIPTASLRERCWGLHEGRTHADILAEAGIAPDGTLPHVEGAETKLNIYMRASEFLREIYAKHTDETILLVGHNGINKALIHAITNEDPEKLLKKHSNTQRFGNTSVSIFTIDDKSYEIELLNCTKHLE